MRNFRYGFWSGLSLLIIFLMCMCQENKNDKDKNNDWNSGKVVIAADSNLKEVLEPLVVIYENYFPKADIEFNFKSEETIINDFKDKKNKAIAVSRLLSENELKNIAFTHDVSIEKNTFAYDAIAVVANKNFTDSVYTIENTTNYLQNKTMKLVFDHPKSGIARSLMELSGTAPEAFKNAFSLSNTNAVLQYVAANSDAVGFIPYHLFSNRLDKTAQYIRSNFKILPVSYRDTTTVISQKTISDEKYALMRPISIYIGNCPEQVIQGFTSFLLKRQISKALLISGMVPKNLPVREVIVTEEFNPNEKK